MSHKLTARQAVARAFPTYDYVMADRMISWLEDCGYEIVEKDESDTGASLVPAGDRKTVPELERSH